MGKTITILNQKGGVGKTTTALALSSFAANKGEKILVVDLDGQANATARLLYGLERNKSGIFDLFIDEDGKYNSAENIYVAQKEFPNVFVLAADKRLVRAEAQLAGRVGREGLLKKILSPLKPYFSHIIIDNPPAINVLTLNGLVASDQYLIPVDLSPEALDGARDVIRTVELLVKHNLISSIEFLGVLVCRYEKSNTRAAKKMWNCLKEEFGNSVFEQTIPSTVKIMEAAIEKTSVLSDRCGATAAYYALGKTLMGQEHMENRDEK